MCVSVCALWGYIYLEALRSVWQVGGQEEVEDEGIDKMVQGRWEERGDVRWRNSGGGRRRDGVLEASLNGQIIRIKAFPVPNLHQCSDRSSVNTLRSAGFRKREYLYICCKDRPCEYWRREMMYWNYEFNETDNKLHRALFWGGLTRHSIKNLHTWIATGKQHSCCIYYVIGNLLGHGWWFHCVCVCVCIFGWGAAIGA